MARRPKDLRSKLDFSVDTADGQRVAPGIPAESARAFHERLVKIYADPTVFDEAPSLPGAQRGPVTMARCGFADEYKLGTRLGEAVSRLGFLAPVLRQYLIDEGVDSQLATQTVEMFGHPIIP